MNVVLVTGSSGGIGRGLAVAYDKGGFQVVVHYNTNRKGAEETARGCARDPIILRADVRDENQVREMMTAIDERLGHLTVLVNNAATYDDAVVWKMGETQWDDVVDTGLKGVFLCTKYAVPLMRRSNYGRILNISSVVGDVGIFGTSNYAATKAGLVGFTRAVAKEVVKFGITVNALVLGYFATGMYLRLSDNVRKAIEARIPLGRPGNLDEVVAPTLFLTTDPRAGYITGQAIHVNGGYYP